MTSALRENLGRLFQQAINAIARSVGAIAGVRQRMQMRRRAYWNSGIAFTLNNLVREIETRASGRVQVISLAEFRGAIGALWETYQSRILLIAESTIARMIGRGGTFIPQGDDTWLLLFPRLSEEAAQARTDAIAARIGDKLMGQQFTPHELPLPVAAKLDLTGVVGADGSLDVVAVHAAVERARQAQSSTPSTNHGQPNPTALPAGPARPAQRSAAHQLQVLYRPAWCADTQTVDTYFFRAFTDSGLNLFTESGPSMNAATAAELVHMAAASFTAMCKAGLRAKFVLPLQFSTLQGSALPEVQRTIAQIAQHDRLLQLRIEIVGAARITADRLIGARELFRAYVREVAFLVSPFSPQDPAWALDHIMLGADVSQETSHNDDEFFQAMLLFQQHAGRRGTYVLGLQSRKQLAHAVRAGINEVGGPAFLDDVKRLPERIAIVRREELLAP